MTDQDFAAVLRINAASRPHVAALDQDELSRLQRLGSRAFVAETATGDIDGYLIAFTGSDDYDGEEFRHFQQQLACGFLYIDQVAIRSESRRSGGGHQLYLAAMVFAQTHSLEKLCCEVNLEPPNPRSMAFHLKQGFAMFGKLDFAGGRTVALLVRDTTA